ncbi:MAG TPA: hypothetical protein VHX63_08450 [Acidobacteriaceae bacterium]|jgi:hypothetical protein|nr:hypothetical protein [Acidobacteriaceae bacterium]
MRSLALLLLLAGTVPSAFSAKRVSIKKVDQLLIRAQGKSDTKVAKQLFNLELTQRVSSTRFARWEAELPGPKSQQALVALADASAFLPLPPEEISATPAPSLAVQASLLTRAGNYVTNTIPELPNFFATRDTTRFSDEPENIESLTLDSSQYRQLHLVGVSTDRVYFRAGKEVIVANTNKDEQVSSSGRPLATHGVFGEAMELILSDVLQSSPVWSHWEGSAEAPLAVFRYAVPLEKSHYAVAIPDAPGTAQPHVAYHGEIAIDQANGIVLRLTIAAELSRTSRISTGDVMVEYGPVEIGGIRYTCPTRSVSLTIQRIANTAPSFQYKLDSGSTSKAGPPLTTANDDSTQSAPPITSVNDVRFKDYHRFRAEIRILP